MFYFKADDVEYRVAFRHEDSTRNSAKRMTICSLQRKGIVDDDHSNNNWIELGHGVAHCSKQDQFVKATGRKIALTRMLEYFERSDRKVIWQAYWERYFGVVVAENKLAKVNLSDQNDLH